MKDITKKILNYPFLQVKIKIYLFLAFVCAVSYWPVSLDLFTLKSDAIMYFLPFRYNISNAIQNGELPLWSPYLYMGFPMHADMQSGAWNPIVWLISLFTRYNMSVLHFETLLYVFIAGIGMYKLLQEFGYKERVKLITAVSYMCCGFITDSGQFIVWIAPAAYLPFVFLYYLRVLYKKELLNAIKFGFALYLLLVSGYPSFFIYCGYILLAAFIIELFRTIRTTEPIRIKQFAVRHFISLVIFIAFSLPALISYTEFLPYFTRGNNVSLAVSQINPFCTKCSVSFLLPFNLSRENIGFGTGNTMRNIYTGIFTMVFLVYAFQKKIRGIQWFVLIVSIITLLFSMGDATPIRKFAFSYIPLMNYFRHPANMRLFVSIGVLLIASRGIQTFFESAAASSRKTIRGIIIAIAVIITSLIVYNQKQTSFVYQSFNNADWRTGLKAFFYNINFASAILFIGILQILFLAIFFISKRNQQSQYLLFSLAIINVMLMCQFALPATFVSKASPKNIDAFISSFPSGYPSPDLTKSLKQNAEKGKLENTRILGESVFYSKREEIPDDMFNPTILQSFNQFHKSSIIRNTINNYPPVYFSDSVVRYADTALFFKSANLNKKYVFADIPNLIPNNNKIEVHDYRADGFGLNTTTSGNAYLNILQTRYKHWKAYIDGVPTPIIATNLAFMTVLVPGGNHLVTFKYQSPLLNFAIIISLAMYLIMIYLLIKHKRLIESNSLK